MKKMGAGITLYIMVTVVKYISKKIVDRLYLLNIDDDVAIIKQSTPTVLYYTFIQQGVWYAYKQTILQIIIKLIFNFLNL